MQQNMQKNSPPEKYLVLSVKQLKDLIEYAHLTSVQEGKPDWNTVVLRLEHSGKRAPGQLRYTDEFRWKCLDKLWNVKDE